MEPVANRQIEEIKGKSRMGQEWIEVPLSKP
jgi:hypothetical protein